MRDKPAWTAVASSQVPFPAKSAGARRRVVAGVAHRWWTPPPGSRKPFTGQGADTPQCSRTNVLGHGVSLHARVKEDRVQLGHGRDRQRVSVVPVVPWFKAPRPAPHRTGTAIV